MQVKLRHWHEHSAFANSPTFFLFRDLGRPLSGIISQQSVERASNPPRTSLLVYTLHECRPELAAGHGGGRSLKGRSSILVEDAKSRTEKPGWLGMSLGLVHTASTLSY